MSFESRFDFVPLGSLAKFINGDRGENYPKPTDYVTDGIPFLSATDVGEGKVAWREAKKISPASYSKLRGGQVQRGDLLFCLRGSLGKLGYVENDLKGAIASSLVILRASNESIARYLRFVLGGADAQRAIKSLDNGSVQGNISAAALKSLMVPNPPEGIRTSITAVLESVDGRIYLNRRINQTLEAMAQAIFKSWFVDFDPVKAKIAALAEGRDPLRAAMSSISGKPEEELDALPTESFEQLAATAALFPDEMEDSELGEIPKGWIYPDIETLANIKQGKYLGKEEMQDTVSETFSIPVWGGNGVLGYSKKLAYSSPVVLMTCRGSNCGLIRHTESAAWVSNNSFACTPKIGSTLFLLTYFQAELFDDCVSGSAQPQITYTSLKTKKLKFPVEPNVCTQFSKLTDSTFSAILSQNKQISELSDLRDTLLPKLLSGELSVAGLD